MLQTHSPIKLSRQLAVLSRAQHDTHLFVWKIRQGIACGIAAQRIGSYCEWYWNNHLSQNFRNEEMALSKVLPVCDGLLNVLFEDHEAIKSQMNRVLDFPTYHLIERLAQIVYYHVSFKEKMLFPHMEDLATKESLARAASLLQDSKKSTPTWSDEFWIKLK
jgi:hypothetical protein